MDLGLGAYLTASAADRLGHRPDFFRTTDPSDRARLKELLERTAGLHVFDELPSQLEELVKSLNPAVRYTKDELRAAALAHPGTTSLEDYGVWVHYPWANRLVHLLDEEEFVRVRTDRNRNKITRNEQERLARLKVGVIGLSVGQSVSLTMALERGFGEIRLADFDTLELGNLNRIRSGLHHLGVNKTVNAAREIAEIDPFLKVTCFPDGITKANMDRFFHEGGDLDVLIEECDSVDIKILSRQKARSMRIPVVMDMSDRGCLDVERFDLEPDRPLMHGWIDHLDLEAAGRPMTAEEKVPYMIPISGVETLSARMKASVIELGQTVGAWPQLATSVVLGGALAGDVVRRIALDQFHGSGRWFVDLDELIGDPSPPARPPSGAAPEFRLGGDEMEAIRSTLGPGTGTAPPGDRLEQLVQAGGAAPSAGNAQPWKFLWHDRRLLLFHDQGRSASFWDPDHFIAQVALGTCVENVVLEAHGMGLEVQVSAFPVKAVPALVAAFEFPADRTSVAEAHDADRLVPMIGVRCTDRKNVARVALPDGLKDTLDRLASGIAGCRAHFVEDPQRLDALARICGAAERIRVVNPIGHREFFHHELRWTREEAERTRDGLDIATLEVSIADDAGLRVAADPKAMALIDDWRGGRGLERLSGRALRAASGVALISVAQDDPLGRLNGGRAAERLWMAANAAGWAVHPVSAPIFLGRAAAMLGEGLRDHERTELLDLHQQLLTLWGITPRHPLFMVRLSPAHGPSVRSLRLPVEKLWLSPLASPLPA
ncbi:MAG TPA: Rv1355c family protein [Flavobacteriales bacterium]